MVAIAQRQGVRKVLPETHRIELDWQQPWRLVFSHAETAVPAQAEEVWAAIVPGDWKVDDNPYYEQHVQAEIELNPYVSRKRARQLVENEFPQQLIAPRQCPCGGYLWYRATVGARICGCGQMASQSGKLYRKR